MRERNIKNIYKRFLNSINEDVKTGEKESLYYNKYTCIYEFGFCGLWSSQANWKNGRKYSD